MQTSTKRSTGAKRVTLALANLLIPVAVVLFAKGFFPYKPVLPGLAQFGDDGGEGRETDVRLHAKFDRVVFMVVDALRSDFVYGEGSGMVYTQSLIRDGAAIPFTAHATPPTVTMPRVKALTTGSVPSFLDLILNFAESDTSSSLAAQDTWLAQIKAQGGKVVFYGDDTWLKLFPDSTEGVPFFARHDGTSSFFVSDFTEVDNNVTRHVPEELARDDWNAMVMHYLGLDHIGHKTGPQGPNMLPKQREMDGIVKVIYEAIETEKHHQNTLLVLAGDHGMNAGGNHGGSGPGETEPALLFASPKFKSIKRDKRKVYQCPTQPKDGTEFHYYTKVEQSDLVPSLAGLMGLPISRNSLGVSIPEIEGLLDEVEQTNHLQRNVEQILQIIRATYGSWDETILHQRAYLDGTKVSCNGMSEGEQQLACLYNAMDSAMRKTPRQHAEARSTAMKFLLVAQETLSGTASSYNIPLMGIGIFLMLYAVGLSLASLPPLWPFSAPGLSFSLVSVLYGVMMFASSYVEEEQQFWYWLTPAWFITLSIASLPAMTNSNQRAKLGLATVVLLAIHRLYVRWNQTGQKHAGAPDIVHNVFPDHHVAMWVSILLTYAYNGYELISVSFAGLLDLPSAALFSSLLILSAITFKLTFTSADAPELVQDLGITIRRQMENFNLVFQARVLFLGIAVVTFGIITLSILSHRNAKQARMKEAGHLPSVAERLHVLLTLFLMTQTRAPNVPLFLGAELQYRALQYILSASPTTTSTSRTTKLTTTILLLTHTSFFAFGGSNSISSIDLSNAYNGVADYNILAVGVLLFMGNWAGAVWWCWGGRVLLMEPTPKSTTVKKEVKVGKGESTKEWIEEERSLLSQSASAAAVPTASPPSSDSLSGFWTQHLALNTTFLSIALLATMVSCTLLRTHLFIWTVFSPKFLYAMAWCGGWHLIGNVVLGGAVGAMGGIR